MVDIEDPWKPNAFPDDMYTSGEVPISVTERGNAHTLGVEADGMVLGVELLLFID